MMRPQLEPFVNRIGQADGRPIDVSGCAWIEVRVGRQLQTLNVVVADIRNDAIIGMDFLVATGAKIDFREASLIIRGERIPCYSDNADKLCMRLEACGTTNIPAGHEAYVKAVCKQNTDRDWDQTTALAEPIPNSQLQRSGLMVAYGVINLQEDMYVKVCNVGDEDTMIGQGSLVGKVRPIAEADIQTLGSLCTLTTHTEANADSPAVKSAQVPPYLQDLLNRATENLASEDQSRVKQMIIDYQDVFSSGSDDIGRTSLVKHSINTGSAVPIKQRARRAPMGQQAEIDKQIKGLLEQKLIAPSYSPWSSPVVLVAKKDGTARLCCDYRRLNSVTVKDAFPLPRIDASIDALSGAKWFSTIDLASGYWQVELDEEAKKKSGFAVKSGLYEWNIMSFGLCNAPSTFERLMERVLEGLHWETLLVYLDDIIVWGRTLSEAVARLETVLQRLRSAGLKAKPSKCDLFKTSVHYLGHVVSPDGVATEPEKVAAVKEWPTPKSVRELRSFLGLASYYRRFIHFFANRAKPLHRLLEKGKVFDWTADCQSAFDDLKGCLTSAPILAYPRMEGEFVLDTDASGFAIGAVLSQRQDGELRVIGYASRTLSKAQRNYCVTRRELLAVVAFLKYYRHYLYGRKVRVRTDHGALRWLINFKDPEGQLARWLEVLSSYDLELEHRPGNIHRNADSMSRRPCSQCGRESHDSGEPHHDINANVKSTSCVLPRNGQNANTNRRDADETASGAEKHGQVITTRDVQSEGLKDNGNNTQPDKTPNTPDSDMSVAIGRNRVNAITALPLLELNKIQDEQRADPTIKLLYLRKESGDPRPQWEEISTASQDLKTYWAQWDLIHLRDGVLCRKWVAADGQCDTWKVILPVKLRPTVLQQYHNSKVAGHMGETRTLYRVKERYYWAGMRTDVRAWVRQCSDCARRKPPPRKKRSLLRQYGVGAPLERVALDVLGPLPVTHNGNQYVLVIGDYFSKWIEAYGIPNQQAETVADKFAEFVCRLGMPKELHSDQGSNFESRVFQETLKLLGINKTRTTAYNPKSDGMVERFNKTLVTIVSLMLDPIKQQRDWDDQLKYACLAYRSSRHESTGETPNMLMFGREVSTPLDVMFEAPEDHEDEGEQTSDYVWELREQLRQAHEAARKNLKVNAERQKRAYDRNIKSITYSPKDFVWLHNPQRKIGVSSKLRLPWEGPYLVVDRLSDVHYRIQKSPRALYRVVHADRLKLYTGPEIPSWEKKNTPETEPQPVELHPEEEQAIVSSSSSVAESSSFPAVKPVPAPHRLQVPTPVPSRASSAPNVSASSPAPRPTTPPSSVQAPVSKPVSAPRKVPKESTEPPSQANDIPAETTESTPMPPLLGRRNPARQTQVPSRFKDYV